MSTIAISIGLLMLALLALGIPVGYTLIIASSIGLYLSFGDSAISLIATTPFEVTNNFTLTVIPMFILMAEFLSVSGITTDIFSSINKWTQNISGGMPVATTIANGGMAALSGSSTAAAATMAKIAVPEMRKYNYSDTISMGTVCASGTFAVMIPPSLALIIYGVLTETSIARLFIAGVIPGAMTIAAYIITIFVWVKHKKEGPQYLEDDTGDETHRYTWREKIEGTSDVFPAVVLIIAVLGGLYSGLTTPTEAGAIGAFGAFILGIIYKMDFPDVTDALWNAVKTTSVIFLILIGATLFGYFLVSTRAVSRLVEPLVALPIPEFMLLILLLIVYIALGMFMDQIAILVITLPLTFPLVVSQMGYSSIWFGVILVKTIEIGLVTPPFGLNVYVATSAINVDIGDAFKGAAAFIFADLIVLSLLVLFPEIVQWLPKTMG